MQCGEFIARMDNSLKCFRHTAYDSRLRSPTIWVRGLSASLSHTLLFNIRAGWCHQAVLNWIAFQELNLVPELNSWGEKFHQRCGGWGKTETGETAILLNSLNKPTQRLKTYLCINWMQVMDIMEEFCDTVLPVVDQLEQVRRCVHNLSFSTKNSWFYSF